MLINQENNHKIKQSSNSNKMGINVSKKAFEILSSGIYKEKIPAIVREVTSNSIDASNKINSKEPVVIGFPSNSLEDFYVQDSGIGMTVEGVVEIYANYFASDKEQEANQIGGFGLGGKTPFIYSDTFKLETTSPEDNVRRTFIFSLNDNGPTYSHLDDLDCEDSKIKGTKVSFSIKSDEDVIRFIKGFTKLMFSKYPIDLKFNNYTKENIFSIIGSDLKIIEKITNDLNNKKFSFINEKLKENNTLVKINPCIDVVYTYSNKENIHIRLGDIIYNYNIDIDKNIKDAIKIGLFFDNIDQYFDKTLNVNIDNSYIFLDEQTNGLITLNTSRESINITASNEEKIKKLLEKSTNEFLIESIKNSISFINNMDIDANNLLFFTLYKNAIKKYSKFLKNKYTFLDSILDELVSVIDLKFNLVSEIMNTDISALSINTKIKNKTDENDIFSIQPRYYDNNFNIVAKGNTLNELVDCLYKSYMYSDEWFMEHYSGYKMAYDISKKYFDYIVIVDMNKTFDEYNISNIRSFIKNTRINLFEKNYKKRTNSINFIYFKNGNLNNVNYCLDTEIDNIKKESQLNKRSQVIIKKDDEMNLNYSRIKKFKKIFNYNSIKSIALNCDKIIIPDSTYINKGDSVFEKMFKKNFYMVNNTPIINYDLNTFTDKFNIVVTSNEIYMNLIKDGIIEGEFLDQLVNKYKANISSSINNIDDYVNNEQPKLLERVTEIESNLREYNNIESIFSDKVKNLVSNKIGAEIFNSFNFNDLCKIYITSYDDPKALINSKYDYKNNFDEIINNFKKLDYYIKDTNIDSNCLITDYNKFDSFIINAAKLICINKRISINDINVKYIRKLISESNENNFISNNSNLYYGSDFENIIMYYFKFKYLVKSADSNRFCNIFTKFLNHNYISILSKKIDKNNMIFNDYISQRVYELSIELMQTEVD